MSGRMPPAMMTVLLDAIGARWTFVGWGDELVADVDPDANTGGLPCASAPPPPCSPSSSPRSPTARRGDGTS